MKNYKEFAKGYWYCQGILEETLPYVFAMSTVALLFGASATPLKNPFLVWKESYHTKGWA